MLDPLSMLMATLRAKQDSVRPYVIAVSKDELVRDIEYFNQIQIEAALNKAIECGLIEKQYIGENVFYRVSPAGEIWLNQST